jgi:hypothetical protein
MELYGYFLSGASSLKLRASSEAHLANRLCNRQ